MDEQLLKDFLATVEKYKYDYDVVMPKFPELQGYDLQLLKDYAATAEKYNYDYSVINPKFPEFKLDGVPALKKKDETLAPTGSDLEASGQPATGTPASESELTSQPSEPFISRLPSVGSMSSLPSELKDKVKETLPEGDFRTPEEKTNQYQRPEISREEMMSSFTEGVEGVGEKKPIVTLEGRETSTIKQPFNRMVDDRFKTPEYKPEEDKTAYQEMMSSFYEGVEDDVENLPGTSVEEREKILRDREKFLKERSEFRENYIKEAYIDEIVKTGVSREDAEKNLTKIAFKNYLFDPEGEGITKDPVASLKDVDKDEVMAYRDKLVEQYEVDMGKTLKDLTVAKYIENNDGDVEVAQEKFFEGMNAISESFLSDSEKQIKGLKESVYRLESFENLPEEKRVLLEKGKAELQRFIDEGLIGSGDLYDYKTGQFVSGNTKDERIIAFNNELKKKKSMYENTDLGQLIRDRDDSYFKFEAFLNQALEENLDLPGLSGAQREIWAKRFGLTTPTDSQGLNATFTKEQAMQIIRSQADSPFNFSGFDAADSSISDSMKIINSEVLDPAITKKAEKFLATFMATNSQIALNEDRSSREKYMDFQKYTDELRKFGGDALEGPAAVLDMMSGTGVPEGIIKGFKENMGATSMSELDQSRRAIERLSSIGYDLTDDQKEVMEVTTAEKFSEAAGGLAPVMVELAATSMVTGGISNALKIPKLLKAVAGGKKPLEKGLKFSYNMGMQGLNYELAGQSFSSGVGEFLGESVGEGLIKALGSKNPLLNVLSKAIIGAGGETMAEYSGEFVERLVEDDDTFSQALDKTIGTAETAGEKLATTYFLSLMMSSTMGMTGVNAEWRKDIEDTRRDLESQAEDSELIRNVLDKTKGLESNLRVMAEAEKRIRERDGLEPDAEISEKDLMSEVSTIMDEGNKKINEVISSSISDVSKGEKSLAEAFDEVSKTTGADLIIEEQFGKLETEADKKAAMLLMAYNADAETKSNPEFVNWYKATEKELSGLENKSEIVEAALAVQEQEIINQQKQTDDVQEQQAEDVEVRSGQKEMQEPDVEQRQEEVGVYTTEDIVESTDAKAFADAQSSALSQRTDTKLQVDPTSEQDAQKIIDEGGKLFLTSDGKAGAYVTADGYMGGLFKDPNSNKNQASKALQEVRTKAGGKFFDAFGINPETGDGTTLEEIYVKNGFRPVARMPFDPDMAPKGWENTTLASRPDNVFFVYDPDYKAEVGEGEAITDFDKAYEMAKNYEPTSTSNSANKTVVEPGKRLFNEPNKETAQISKKYREEKGIEFDEGEPITELDEDLSKEIADAYEAMEDNPNDPEVKEAYDALALETVDQYKALMDAGYEVEIYKGKGEPYANSEEMIKDLKENKHIYIFSTEGGFGETGITDKQRSENAMLGSTEFKDVNGDPLLVNDLFRAVHDFFGHSERGNGFGAIGEENAWDVHARMFSDKARRAMTTETKGQNSWVNFGPQMRGKDGKILKKGDKEYLKPSERKFAEQKMGLLPEKYSEISSTKKEPTVSTEETFEVADDVIPEATEGALSLLDAFGKKPKKSKVTPKKRKQVLDQVAKAEKALSKISPKTKIVVHETSKDYKSSGRNRNQNEGGVYEVDSEGNGTIHINLESANERTVAHEVFHALLLSKGMGDKQAQAITNKMLDAVKKSASPELLAELEEFSKKYVLEDENGNPILDKNGNTIPDPVQSEESIAELFGILASEYDTLPRPTQNIIKRWLDKLAKLFGLKLFTDNEVVDMLNTVSRSVREGSVIEESDIDVIRRDPMLARDTRADFLGGIPVDELTDADLDQNQTRQWSDGRSQIGTATRKQITEESIKNSVVSDIIADYTYVFDDYGREIVLPKKETVKNVLEKSGGYAVFINSDGTKVGVRSNGELLDGGWQYTFIKENVDSNIGFAATSETHVKTLHKMVSELTAQRDSVNPESKGKPIAVFVTVQNGETMLGEWYAGEYFFEGIDKAITENKFKNGVDTFRKLMTDALSFKSKINESRKKIRELKKQNQTNETKSKIEALKNRVIRFKKKASSRETVALLKLINSDKFKTHDGRIEIAKEFASKKFTFGFRVNLLKSLIPLKSATGGNKIIKKALLDVDHGRQEFYQEHLDGSLLNRLEETSYDETSIGGVTLGGFYMDPYVSKKKFFENRKNGIDHAQFNESFSSNGETFRLDKAHDVNKLNPYMGYPTANGYKVYNKENGTNINKKNASIKDRHDIVAYLDNKYGNKKDGKNLFALPFTSIGGSMYTPTDSEIEFNDTKSVRRRKQKPSDDRPSIEAVRKKAKELGVSEKDTYIALKKMNYTNAEIRSTEAKSIADAKEKYNISVNRRSPREKALESAIGDLQSTYWYQNASDTQRDDAVKKLMSELGFEGKKSPSVKKILGKPKEKKVTMTERSALKSQIRMEARAARGAVKSYKDASKDLIDHIKELSKTGVIKSSQASVMIKKVLGTNMLNKKAVKKMTDYIDKVYSNAELAAMIQAARKLSTQAKKNLRGKVGPSKSMQSVLENLFSLDPTMVPMDVFDTYVDLLNQFGKRKAVLDLEESSVVLDKATKVLDAVEESIKETEISETDGTEISETDETTSNEEEVDFDKYAEDVLSEKISMDNLDSKEAKDLAEYLNKLTKKDVEALVTEKKDGSKSYAMLENLRAVKKNMTNGFVPSVALRIKTMVESKKSADKIKSVVESKVKNFNPLTMMSRGYGIIKGKLTGKRSMTESVRGNSVFSIDDILGNFNDKSIHDNTFRKLSTAYSSYQTDMEINVKSKLDAAEKLLHNKNKFFQKLENKVQESKYKLQAYRLQREFESNPESSQVVPAVDFINETIRVIKKDKAGTTLNKNDIRILEKIKEDFGTDGQIDLEKIEKSMTSNEKKALKLIDEASNLQSKALWTSAVIRGEKIKPINNYVHHNVKTDSDAETVIEKSKGIMNPSTKAGTLNTRTPGVKAINFDPISSTEMGARQTLLDYHMTESVREVSSTLSQLQKMDYNTDTQQEAINAIDNTVRELLEATLNSQLANTSILDKGLAKIKKLGYQSSLASIPRAAAELGSNLMYAMTKPKEFVGGVKEFGRFSIGSRGIEAMNNLGSSETMRLYDTHNLTGKMTDSGVLETGARKTTKTRSEIEDKIRYLDNLGPKQVRGLTTIIADALISTPDKAVSRPMWFGTFASEFKKLTGETISSKEMDKIADGTSKYLDPKYNEYVKEAAKVADRELIKMSNTNNPFNSTPKNLPNAADSALKTIYKSSNSYMASFMLNEFATARNAVLSIFEKGDMTKGQAAAALTGIQMRMASYMVMYSLATGLFDSMFGAEEEEKDTLDLIKRQMLGAPISLITGSSLGNIPRMPINYAVEKFNEKYLEGLRSGEEYNPYKHSLVFSQITEDDLSNKSPEELTIKMFGGPFSPLMSSIFRAITVYNRAESSKKEETKERYQKEWDERISMEALGNLGQLPLYKDIRRIWLKKFFKDKKKK